MIEGTDVEPGLLPRILTELFAIRKEHGLVMSLSFVEVSGNSVRDVVDKVVLKSAQVEDVHVQMGAVDQCSTREVLGMYRVKTLQLLHTVLQRRSPSNMDGLKPHFITIIRMEQLETRSVASLFVCDLAGIPKPGREFAKSSVAVNSNLVRRRVQCFSLCCICSSYFHRVLSTI
jgi:hypothetical protein